MNLLFNNRLISISSKILIGCFVVLAYGLIQGHSALAATSCTFASVGTSAWSTAANWTCNDASHNVPTSTVNAIIPIATSTSLSVDSSAKSVTIGAGSTLTFNSHNLDVAGDWADSGTIVPGTGIVSFSGGIAQNIAAEANFYDLIINKSGNTATLTGNVTSTHDFILTLGTFALSDKRLSIGRNYSNVGGTLSGDTGTVEFDGAGAQGITAEPNFNNILIRKSAGTVVLTGDVAAVGALDNITSGGTLSAEAFTLDIGAGSSNVAGAVVTSTTGTIIFRGAMSNNGSLGSSHGNLNFASGMIVSNAGNIDVGTGVATSTTGTFNGAGIINCNSGILVIRGTWSNGATFNRGTGTVVYEKGGLGGPPYAQTLRGAYIYNNLNIKTVGTVTADANVTVNGTLNVSSGTTFNLDTLNLAVTGATTNVGTTTSTTGVLTFNSAVTNSGSIGTVSGSELFTSTLDNSGTLSLGAGTATSTGSLTNTGTINQESGKLALLADYSGAGTFNGQAGTTWLYGTADQSIRGVTFYNLQVSKPTGIATIVTADATLDGTLVLEGAGTLNAGDRALTALHGVSIVGSTVTSTTGTLTLAGIANAGFIGSSRGNMLFPSLSFANAGGVLNIGSGTATSTISFPSDGTINGNSGTIVLARNGATFIWNAGATFNAQAGTVKYARSTGAQTVSCSYTYNNLDIETVGGNATLGANCIVNGTLKVGALSTLNADVNSLSVAGTTNNLGTTTSTTGVLTFNSAVTNSGSIGSDSGNKFFGSTLANSGTLDIGSGIATTTGNVTGAGTVNGNTGTLIILSNFTAGTFNSGIGTATVKFNGAANQSIKGLAFNDVIVEKTAGTVTFITTDAFIGGTLGVWQGTLSAGSVNLTVLDNTTIVSGGMVTSTTGNLDFFSAVGNSGNVGSSSGDIFFESPLLNNGTLDVGSGTVTTTNSAFVAAGTINGDNGTLIITDAWPTGGTFNRGTGTVRYVGATPQDVMGEYVYNNLVIDKSAGTATLDSHATTTNFTLAAGTLAVGSKIFDAQGVYTNHGLVTRTTGKIKHAADYENFVNSSGVTQTAYTTPGTIYFEVKDLNRNMNGAAADTLTVPVSVDAAAGGDTETITLTETGLATGIFRSGAIGFYTGILATPGNNEIVITHTGIGTETYTDNQDSGDTGATTATLTYAGVVNPPGGGGGGGGGGLPPVVTHYESGSSDSNRVANLANLSSMGLPIHSLVKLADDGNGATQEDSAVYYVGNDGKRHAFPNSKIYFTWYSNFDKVTVITASQLASIPLGTNVRYKPGSRMVKFTTDLKVYAVDAKGTLRWVKTEDLAKALYGNNWNTKIDDLSDAFFGNYSFGTDVNSASDFDVNKVMASEPNISEDF